jgi:adenosine deaminase
MDVASLLNRPVVPDEAAIRALPKAEVHVHLEGTFELADLLELSKAAGEPLPGPARSLLDVSSHFPPTDPAASPGAAAGGAAVGLSSFLRFLDWECGLVRTPEQAARTAYRFAARESSSGIRYADVIVNPTHWNAWRDRLPALFDALAQGLAEAEQDGLATVNLCVSLLRQQSPQEAVELAEWVVRDRPDRVVALSIDGNENAAGRTGPRFAEAFTLARDGGLHRTVHAGESSGPEGVWDAIRLLHAERIDHGVRAIEDPDLVGYLADSEITLGVCPRSNLALGLYPDLAGHPLAALRAAGVGVTVNTDDPAPLGIRLESEWAVCAAAFGWDMADMCDFARTSISASFAPDELKDALRAELGRMTS